MEFIYFTNSIHYLKNLQTNEGITQYENKIRNLNERISNLIRYGVIIIVGFLLFKLFFTNFFINILLYCLILPSYIILLVSLIITKKAFISTVECFITYCQTIVKFEDYLKVIFKVFTSEQTFLNEMLILLTYNYREYLNNITRTLKDDDIKTDKNEKWKEYLQLKSQTFTYLFNHFDNYYPPKKIYVTFVSEVFIHIHLINKTNNLINNIENVLTRIKAKYDNMKQHKFKSDEEEESEKLAIIDRICSKVSDSKKKILLEKIVNLYLSNKNISKEYKNLIELLRDKFDEEENINNKFELILEKKYHLINVLKQIKYQYHNNLEVKNTKDITVNDSNKNVDYLNKGVSLFDIELPNNSKIIKVENNEDQYLDKVRASNISHYELLKREEESRKLQTRLLFDLDQFQSIKTNQNQSSNEDNNGILLENALNND